MPIGIASNFDRLRPLSPEMDAMEPWSTAILPLGACSPGMCPGDSEHQIS